MCANSRCHCRLRDRFDHFRLCCSAKDFIRSSHDCNNAAPARTGSTPPIHRQPRRRPSHLPAGRSIAEERTKEAPGLLRRGGPGPRAQHRPGRRRPGAVVGDGYAGSAEGPPAVPEPARSARPVPLRLMRRRKPRLRLKTGASARPAPASPRTAAATSRARGPTMLVTVPEAPARAVRPTRCRCVTALVAKSSWRRRGARRRQL